MALNNVDGADYTLTPTGIQLNNGLTFQDNDHINVRILDPQGNTQTVNMHIEGKCAPWPAPAECSELKHHQAKLIGQNYVPYEVIGMSPDLKSDGCIQWVQFARSNYHYEDPQCSTTPPPPEPPLPPTGGDVLPGALLGLALVVVGALALFGKKLRRA